MLSPYLWWGEFMMLNSSLSSLDTCDPTRYLRTLGASGYGEVELIMYCA